jgi:hypothetical protein
MIIKLVLPHNLNKKLEIMEIHLIVSANNINLSLLVHHHMTLSGDIFGISALTIKSKKDILIMLLRISLNSGKLWIYGVAI